MTAYIVAMEATVTAFVEVDADSPEEAARFAPEATEGAEWEYGSARVVESYRRGTAGPKVYEAWAPCDPDLVGATPWCRVHDNPMRREDPTLCYGFGEGERAAGLPIPRRMDGARPCFCYRDPGPVIHTPYCDAVAAENPRARP